MKKLGERNYMLIKSGVKTHGTYDPDKILYIFEENLYCDEIGEICDFLKWCHTNGKHFGSGNYEDVFKEFKEANKK